MKTIVVTGASGFVGRHLCRALMTLGHEVIALHRGTKEPLDGNFATRNIIFDIDSSNAVPPEAFRADALIYLSWPDLPNYDRAIHFEKTLPRSYEFIRECVQNGLRHILTTGTCFEYGLRNGKLSEWMRPDPQNSYSVAKDSLRRFLTCLKTNHDFTLQWVRLFYLYGPGQHPRTLMAQLDAAIARGDSRFNMSPGDQLRDYLPIEEVARRLAIFSDRPDLDGIFNCCSGEAVSIRTLVEQRIRERGAKIALNLGHYPYSPFEPMAFWGDTEKTKRLFAS